MNLEQLQQILKERFQEIKAALLAKGFNYRAGVFAMNGVQVWVSEGNLAIQRHLGLQPKAFMRFTVKSVKTVHEDVFDDPALSTSSIVEQVSTLAAEHARVLSLAT